MITLTSAVFFFFITIAAITNPQNAKTIISITAAGILVLSGRCLMSKFYSVQNENELLKGKSTENIKTVKGGEKPTFLRKMRRVTVKSRRSFVIVCEAVIFFCPGRLGKLSLKEIMLENILQFPSEYAILKVRIIFHGGQL